MKKSLTWRLFVLVAGALLGLIASMGLAAPAVASPVQVAASGDYKDRGHDRDELTLKADRDGKYISLKVIGKNYDSDRVKVTVFQVNNHGKYRAIDHRKVWPDHKDNFKYQVKYVKCGNSYVAYSEGNKDGKDWSGKITIKCDRKGQYHG